MEVGEPSFLLAFKTLSLILELPGPPRTPACVDITAAFLPGTFLQGDLVEEAEV